MRLVIHSTHAPYSAGRERLHHVTSAHHVRTTVCNTVDVAHPTFKPRPQCMSLISGYLYCSSQPIICQQLH